MNPSTPSTGSGNPVVDQVINIVTGWVQKALVANAQKKLQDAQTAIVNEGKTIATYVGFILLMLILVYVVVGGGQIVIQESKS